MTVPSGICAPSLAIAVSPAVRITVLFAKTPRGAACRTNASRSPSQKLEWTTSGSPERSAEISAPYWPESSFGICEVVVSTAGLSALMADSKSFHESWPQA